MVIPPRKPFPRPSPKPSLEAINGISTIGFIDEPAPETPEPLEFPNGGDKEIPDYVPKNQELAKSYI